MKNRPVSKRQEPLLYLYLLIVQYLIFTAKTVLIGCGSRYSLSVFTFQMLERSRTPFRMLCTVSKEVTMEWSILLYRCWPLLPHAVKIINAIQIRPQLIDILVSIKISRISLFHLFHRVTITGGTVDKSHLYHFLNWQK